MDIGWNPVPRYHNFDDPNETQDSSDPPNFWTFMESIIPGNEETPDSKPENKPFRNPLARSMMSPKISSADHHENYYSNFMKNSKDDDDNFFNFMKLTGDVDDKPDEGNQYFADDVEDSEEDQDGGLGALIKTFTDSLKGPIL